ncbi:spore coat protein, outer [Mycolicibacterium brisbanense]|uniref:Spore coat protein, outer n=1 Tax=Mycolicibacterium brisbanense TaxID=146020 RepID=A0A100VWA1_9MYCO|nr:spore coat protein, outer [Mycolicibacterium brisbanense]
MIAALRLNMLTSGHAHTYAVRANVVAYPGDMTMPGAGWVAGGGGVGVLGAAGVLGDGVLSVRFSVVAQAATAAPPPTVAAASPARCSADRREIPLLISELPLVGPQRK